MLKLLKVDREAFLKFEVKINEELILSKVKDPKLE